MSEQEGYTRFYGAYAGEFSPDTLTSRLASKAMSYAVSTFERLYQPNSQTVIINTMTSQVTNINGQGRFHFNNPSYRVRFYQTNSWGEIDYRLGLTEREFSTFFVKLITFYVQELFIQAYLTKNPSSELYNESLCSGHGKHYTNEFANRAMIFLNEHPSIHFKKTLVYKNYFLKQRETMKQTSPPRLTL